MTATVRQSIKPIIDCAAIFRYLGYPNREAANARVAAALAALEGEIDQLLNPQGVYCLCPGADIFAADFPLYNKEVYVAIVTIGHTLEQKAKRLADDGQILESFVLDTLGSVYAEGTAEALYRELAADAGGEHLNIGCRISPGYGEWALNYQKNIFAVLPAKEIKVALTDSLMMNPRKSVSFATERARNPLRMREGDQCQYCEFEQCRFRRAQSKTANNEHS